MGVEFRESAQEQSALERGVLNLLHGCVGAKPGESVVLFEEDPAAGYYEDGLGTAIANVARRVGIRVQRHSVAFQPDATTLGAAEAGALSSHDHAIFLARLGDQLRFRTMPKGARPTVSYVLDRAALSSPFGSAPYDAFVMLKQAVNRMIGSAAQIRVTCPRGTDFSGAAPSGFGEAAADVFVKRFPMSVFAPLPAEPFTGRIAVAHLLCGTGSRYYEPYGFRLGQPLLASIGGGRLLEWQGPPDEVARVRAHYRDIADRFGIDADAVHSWHAGIHPGCVYPGSAHDNYERWSGSAFGNPRILHFHTCGSYAPGEISLNILDPTIEIDGARVWHRGRIDPRMIPGAAAILAAYPDVEALFASPEQDIGLDGDGCNR